MELESLGLKESKVKVVEASVPPKKQGGVTVKDVDELLEKLKTEAKVI